MCVCIYIYIYIHTYTYIHTHTYTHTYIDGCVQDRQLSHGFPRLAQTSPAAAGPAQEPLLEPLLPSPRRG